jgi:hypothetical protein
VSFGGEFAFNADKLSDLDENAAEPRGSGKTGLMGFLLRVYAAKQPFAKISKRGELFRRIFADIHCLPKVSSKA